MSFAGKIFGALLGLALTHHIFGAILGIMIGHYFDIGLQSARSGFNVHFGMNAQHQRLIQETFFKITFLVMGHIAKADGRVSEAELHAARAVMVRLRLDARHTREAMRLFTEGKQPNFDVNAAIHELFSTCRGQPILLQMFYEIQCQAAMANRTISRDKQAILQAIWHQLGLSGQGSSQYYGPQTSSAPNERKRQAYQTLGLSPAASPAEIKRAYRKLMSQHHPDKLIAKGLPEEMIKMATDKTQQIQKAYELISQPFSKNAE